MSRLKILILIWALATCTSIAVAQEKKDLVIGMSYYLGDNQLPYLKLISKTKEGKAFIPVPATKLSVYLGEQSDAALLGNITTDEKGSAIVPIPANLKRAWDSSYVLQFLAFSGETAAFASADASLEIRKAKIRLDTVADAETPSLRAAIYEITPTGEVPAAEVELKLVIRRTGGDLSIGEDEFYTTDSTGTATGEFTRSGMAGDRNGYLVIVAKTEDNELYGNLSTEKKLPWGQPPALVNDFSQRSLYGTRDKAPVWLLILAYSTAGGVWFTLIYIISRIFKIRKIGYSMGS
ncbi:MAG TPA: hypothetical protein VF145_04605 [Chitinophagaceae bacterium]